MNMSKIGMIRSSIVLALFLASCMRPLENKQDGLEIKKPLEPEKAQQEAEPAQYEAKMRAVKNLVDKQNQQFPKILAELNAGRKTSHWIWWVFPTTLKGASEPEPKTFVDAEMAGLLLKEASIDAWSEILEKIYDLLKKDQKGAFKPAHNRPNPDIIPKIDHGRIHFALKFWLEEAKDVLKKYPRFFDALKNLTAFDWQ